MGLFVGRQQEMEILDTALEEDPAQLILCYGRRQVGKTTLILRWAEQTGRAVLYWVAARDTPTQLRQNLGQTVWQWAHPRSRGAPTFNTWRDLFETTADMIEDYAEPVIWIMDQFSYAIESDDSLPDQLQTAWESRLSKCNLTLVLVGSHIGMMVDLLGYDAPLYMRDTAQLPVKPLAFPFVERFLPEYTASDRVATYAITGGVAAYLERFRPEQTLSENVQSLFMQRTSMFRNEPFVLIRDVLSRETKTYQAILKAIAAGKQTRQEMAPKVGLSSPYLSRYLKQLESINFVERRVPATIPLDQQETSRISRYYVADPYLLFYFRFIAPNLRMVEQDQAGLLWQRVEKEFDRFVGETAFQGLCRDWLMLQMQRGDPFWPEIVGTHWSAETEVDIVAINWQERAILLGACEWQAEPISPYTVQQLVDKAALIVPGPDWDVSYILFARSGFAEPTREVAEEKGVRLVDLEQIDQDLRAVYAQELEPAGEDEEGDEGEAEVEQEGEDPELGS